YVQLTGPSYETPAEIRLIRSLGGDLVGMSTVVEAITARHLGLKVCCVSLVSNLAAGISPTPLTEQEVIDAGNAAAPKFSALVKSAISRM
ncbi:MAG TPA: purine-nucleoside phosphorylase, partial [Lachnospiraceae bacterium]|nr:purine-nucleoside phosphorylase [Lachnospiraceae bacterium]